MKVLVTGLLPHDSGKTVAAVSLVAEAVSRGIDIGVAKPVSGFNGWSQYRFLEESARLGLLIGEDLYRLHRAAGSRDPLEMEGPVVVVLTPPDPASLEWRMSSYKEISYAVHRQALLARITGCIGGAPVTAYLYSRSHARRTHTALRRMVEEILRGKQYVEADPLVIEEALSHEALINADSCLEKMFGKHESLVVESYNDAAAPTSLSLQVDAVLVVAPGRIALYKGERYAKAVHVIRGSRNPWQIVTQTVVDLLKPEASIETMPLSEPYEGPWPWAPRLLDTLLRIAEHD